MEIINEEVRRIWKECQEEKGILNCPFCGSVPELKYVNYVHSWLYEVRCPICGIGTDAEEIKEDCLRAWNARVK